MYASITQGLKRAAQINRGGIATICSDRKRTWETVAGPEVVKAACAQLNPDEIIFSLDLKEGRALGRPEKWKITDPFAIAAQAIGNGVRRLLILDLTRVGMGQGTGTEEFCRWLANAYPDLEISAGGGICNATDLRRLAGCGVSSVLVASALHDGQLRPEHWQDL